MKTEKKGLIIGAVTAAAVILLAGSLIIGIVFMSKNKNRPEEQPLDTFLTDGSDSSVDIEESSDEVSETESQTESESETDMETETETETVTQAPETQQKIEVTTVVTTTAAPLPVIEPEYRVVEALGEDTANYLMGLDNTKRGWGQGVNLDEKNRPTGALYAQNTYGGYGSYYIMGDEMTMYLTFDEGYENGYTPLILDTLKAKGVPAVFFVTLHYAKNNPDLIWRMINEGHVIGNHSAYHGSLPTETLEEAYDEVKILHDYIYENFGYTMSLFRFPAGESSDRTQALLQSMGYKSLFWSYAYKDWDPSAQPDPSASLQKLTNAAHPGAIILLHAVSSTNTDILGQLIDNYRSMGYNLARFD